MIEAITFFAFQGGMIGDLFNSWEQQGFFTYLFPMLLVLALVFGILSKLNLFKDNKAINAIISVIIAIISVQTPMVTDFFAVLFPRLGIGLIIILSIILLVGIALPAKGDVAILAVGVIIAIVVLTNTAGSLGWSSGAWWADNWTNILMLVILLAGVGAIIASGSSGGDNFAGKSILGKLLGSDN